MESTEITGREPMLSQGEAADKWPGGVSTQQILVAVLDMASCMSGSGSLIFYWNVERQFITCFDHEDDRDHYNEWSRRPLKEKPDNYVKIGSMSELAEKLLSDMPQ